MAETSFDFITDEKFRDTLEADHREMLACAGVGAWKAVHVLAGSIVEAVLVEYLIREGQQSPNPLQMPLAKLIEACTKKGILSSRTSDLSSVLRSYRNLIHPGRSLRLNDVPDKEGAVVAQALVSIIVREIAASQAQTYGLTAEQIVSKVESDRSALGIADHLLREAPRRELERLLLRVLPDRYFREFEQECGDTVILHSFGRLFRAAFQVADDDLRRRAVSRYVTVLKEEAGPQVQIYEEEFFRASDLKYASEPEQQVAKAHLLARLDEHVTPDLLRAASGLGGVLTSDDVSKFVDIFVRHGVTRDRESTSVDARALLKNEALNTPGEIDGAIIKRLNEWEQQFTQRGQTQRARYVREIKSAYESFDFGD